MSSRDGWSISCISPTACTARGKRAVHGCPRPAARAVLAVSTAAARLHFAPERRRSAVGPRKGRRLPGGSSERRSIGGRRADHCSL